MILFVPAVEKGRGGGHLSRCTSLVKDLRKAGREAFLYLPPKIDRSHIDSLLKSMDFNYNWLDYKNNADPFDFIILDRYQTTLNEILFWKNLAPVIGIDEGGSFRDHFDFLIDILIPHNFIKPSANIISPAFLLNKNFTVKQREPAHTQIKGKDPQKILITFGHEDPSGLGLKTITSLLKKKNIRLFEITLIKGALSTKNIFSTEDVLQKQFNLDNVKILDAIPNLASHLSEYDLVIAHYGITAYEALYAGTTVLLDHPTAYHKKLAKAAGFLDIKHINSFLNSNQIAPANKLKKLQSIISCDSRLNNNHITLAELINGFSPIISKRCPVCGAEKNKGIARLCDRTYRRCDKCGIIYMDRISQPPFEYDKDYFFDSYVKQYGKTYLDDFDNIKAQAKRRLEIIKSLLPVSVSSVPLCETSGNYSEASNNISLLDIGCAYGPFLAAAKEEGFSPFGIDPAQDAVNYVQEKLKISAIHGFFPISRSQLPAPFNVITMWYVIEHFTDCVPVLEEIKKLLKPNGIFAFSTPSFSGVSGRSSLSRFLEASPADHFTIWSPKMCKKALAKAGFKVKKIVVIGYHPERFPLFGKLANNKKSVMYKLLMVISKLFGLGDTFEVYAMKIN